MQGDHLSNGIPTAVEGGDGEFYGVITCGVEEEGWGKVGN